MKIIMGAILFKLYLTGRRYQQKTKDIILYWVITMINLLVQLFKYNCQYLELNSHLL